MTKLLIILPLAAFVLASVTPNVSAQKLDPDDRIGSQDDMCEGIRFKRISGLLEAGKLTEKQAYERWKRISSDKVAVRALLDEAGKDGELTAAQADKLMPILDMKFVARRLPGRPNVTGKFGVNKTLPPGTLKDNEVSQKNRDKVFKRLVAANKRGEIYDYDASSIMLALYTGWDWRKHTPEQEYTYNHAITPRWLQAEEGGFMRKETVVARYARKRGGAASGTRGRAAYGKGYGKGTLKIEDPAAWTKALGKQIFSGPQPGEKLPPFKAVGLSGALEGKEFDAAARAGEALHLLIFAKEARTFGRFLGDLARQLATIERNSKQKWQMSFIVVNDDPNDVEKKFAGVKRRIPAAVMTGLSKDGSDGPPAYGLDRTLTATVIVAKGGKVVHNLPYPSNAFYTQPHILGAVASAMGVDHAALRKFIADTAGDQATAVARGQDGRGSLTPEQRAFRKEIGQKVAAGEMTRDQAAKLYREKYGESRKSASQRPKPGQASAPINSECPVTGKAVKAGSPTAQYRGRTVALCCNKCKSKFEAEPGKYAAALRRR
jgi:YHS domain-containing protein